MTIRQLRKIIKERKDGSRLCFSRQQQCYFISRGFISSDGIYAARNEKGQLYLNQSDLKKLLEY